MSYIQPSFRHPDLGRNALGYAQRDYQGTISTLCAGCGHDSISAAIVQACYEMNVEPHRIAKLSGIGCSSKTPAYFLSNSHAFNAVHGRMPSVATGANLANRDLLYLGVSGDGDSASIGLGQFVHAIRRSLNMTYIVMNNGCYGLTKGQDSATTDAGSKSRTGTENHFEAIDLCSMAINLGASFVARSFSGDKEQLIPLIKAAMSHHGFALLDVLSPCVTFNNNVGSTKSYDYVRDHEQVLATMDYVPVRSTIETTYPEGDGTTVTLHDGSAVHLKKLATDWEPTKRESALDRLNEARNKGEVLTGLLYINTESTDLHHVLNTSTTPLNALSLDKLVPPAAKLESINARYR